MSLISSFLIIVIISLVSSEGAVLDTCVAVTFEKGLENYGNSKGFCSSISLASVWEVGHHTDIDITPPHESSTTFIRSNGLSCTSSFDFYISNTSIVELTFYNYVNSDRPRIFECDCISATRK